MIKKYQNKRELSMIEFEDLITYQGLNFLNE